MAQDYWVGGGPGGCGGGTCGGASDGFGASAGGFMGDVVGTAAPGAPPPEAPPAAGAAVAVAVPAPAPGETDICWYLLSRSCIRWSCAHQKSVMLDVARVMYIVQPMSDTVARVRTRVLQAERAGDRDTRREANRK